MNTPSSTIEMAGSKTFCMSKNRRYDDVVVVKTYSSMPRGGLMPAAPNQLLWRSQKVPTPHNCISQHPVASHGVVSRCVTHDPPLLQIWKDYPATLSNKPLLELKRIRKGRSPLGNTSLSIFLLLRARNPQLVSFALPRPALFL